ncbi:MAG TPA: DNA alkylation repair protein [Planctomycetota bacterium]|nr:DNA alkylation repair protein [Planctomycetota bacterium]
MAEPRKGARRMAEIPPAVLRALNEGREETRTLVEWLAIDPDALLGHVLRDIGLAREAARLRRAFAPHKGGGISRRTRAVGRILRESLPAARRRAAFARLAKHPSDMARSWAAYMVAADERLSLDRRLDLARRFAADPHMAVRECAWDSFRPHLARDLARGLRLLRPWVADADQNVRRCAVEATRPRGVWTEHLEPLKADPAPGLPLLEPLRSDPSDYVRKAVGNWLNDASKTRPDWTRAVCRRWARESRTRETKAIVRRALRTLNR